MLRTVVMRPRISHPHSFSIIKIGFYKCQSYGQIGLNCSVMEEKNSLDESPHGNHTKECNCHQGIVILQKYSISIQKQWEKRNF